MHEIKINLLYGRTRVRVLVVPEQIEIPPVNLVGQMDRQIVEIVLNRIEPFWAMPFALIETRDII